MQLSVGKEAAIRQLEKQHECAWEAGIADVYFISFGTLLGFVREGDFIGYDDDMDMSILADQISREQEEDFIRLVQDRGLYAHRKKMVRRDDTSRVLWTSMMMEKKGVGVKCCHWFWQRYKGYYWHSKGHDWIHKIGYYLKPAIGDDHAAVLKGIKENLFDAGLYQVSFQGLTVNIPILYGTILDYWYPNWAVPKRGGSSKAPIVLTVKEWNDAKSWKIRQR